MERKGTLLSNRREPQIYEQKNSLRFLSVLCGSAVNRPALLKNSPMAINLKFQIDKNPLPDLKQLAKNRRERNEQTSLFCAWLSFFFFALWE